MIELEGCRGEHLLVLTGDRDTQAQAGSVGDALRLAVVPVM